MKKSVIVALAAIAAILVACGPKEDPIVEVTSVSLSQTTLSIARGGTTTLTATVGPHNATDKTVVWSSSNSSVVTVEKGTVSAVAVGTATITATASGKTATCEVTVTPKGITSIRLEQGAAELNINEVFTLVSSVEPADADETLTWSSSDENVAKVENGKITAVGKGKATITASAGTLKVSCYVTVICPINSISLNKSTAQIEEYETLTLTATVDTEDPDIKVEWSSDYTSIATVDDNGEVYGLKVGITTITAKAGDKSASCKVTVKEAAHKAKERAALIKLFNANNGNNWDDHTKQNWCSDKPMELWTGVEMTPDGAHVRSLWLNDSNLKGQIPKEIADLTELEVFKMINPSGIPNNGYPIPSEIGNLKKLKNLTLWTYTVSGTIPKSIYKIQSLEELVLGYIPLSSWTIPSKISNLKNLKELSLPGCNLTGKIPDWIGQITGLEVLNLSSNKLSGSVPASIGSLINLKELDLTANSLSGSIPTAVAKMDNYWRLWPYIFRSNKFTMDNLRDSKIPIPRSPKITTLSGKELEPETEFKKNQYTVLFSFNPRSGDAVECLTQLASLYKANKSKGLGIITYFDNNSALETDRDARDAKFKEVIKQVGATWDSFIRHMYEDYPGGAPFFAKKGDALYPSPLENCIVILGPDQTVVYSTLIENSRDYLNNAVAYLQKTFKTTITHYESKSYTQDGKVTKYQTASTGKGIDIVITGDAFSDRKISDGTFEKAAKQAAADLFSVEPYKSMKNRFNIYFVNAVSKHEEYFNGCSTAFGGVFGYGSAVGGDDDKVLEYAKKAINNNTRMDNVAVLVLMNSIRKGGTCYMMDPSDKTIYGGGSAVCWIPYKDVSVSGGLSSLASTIVHELGGHAIAKLADEYAYRSQGTVTEADVNYTKNRQKNYDWYLNVDFTSDPKKVLWSQFIGDSAFASEKIGVYEGGDTFWFGVWRPTEQSVMNNNDSHSTFNAPCRSLIYTRIMKLSEGSSWKYDYSAFKTWDKAHPTKVATRSIVETNGKAPVHVPPVIVGKTWQEVIGY
ncbi:MAG: Ig-like domain-containing protein [Bacteroidales bacterium]|nr:Ig-like domain-containing protein [Bacteroidales bacterium]